MATDRRVDWCRTLKLDAKALAAAVRADVDGRRRAATVSPSSSGSTLAAAAAPPSGSTTSGSGGGVRGSTTGAAGGSSNTTSGSGSGSGGGGDAGAEKLTCVPPVGVLVDPNHPLFHHRDHRQIMLDVNRSFHFTRCRHWSDDHRERRVAQLGRVLHRAFLGFRVEETIHYFQGAHDVASVLLLTVGPTVAVPCLQRILRIHMRGYVHSDMQVTMCVLSYLYPLIQFQDDGLHGFLQRSKVQPYFALSWIITWFSHSLRHIPTIVCMFDSFLTSHPLMPLYFAATLVANRSSELQQLACEPAAIHQCLQVLPAPFPVWQLLDAAHSLFAAFPPSQLLNSSAVPADARELLLSQWPQLWTDKPPVLRPQDKPTGVRWRAARRAATATVSAVWWLLWFVAAAGIMVLFVWFWWGRAVAEPDFDERWAVRRREL